MSDEEDDNEVETLFSPDQIKRLSEVHDFLKKYFDGYVLVTYVESNDLAFEQARCTHAGGRIQAVGLLHEGLKILN